MDGARGSRAHFGPYCWGFMKEDAAFIGHAGSGFDEKTQEAIAEKLKEAGASACPFDEVPETNEKAHWTRPAIVARIRFTGWTEEKRLRHPVFVGLREDANPQDCQWEGEVAQTRSLR